MSMTIDYTSELKLVGCVTNEDFADVVKYVEWEIHFFETSLPDNHSIGLVKTELDADAITAESFVSFSEVTKSDILAWALEKQGGTEFLDTLLEAGHAGNLEEMFKVSQYTHKDLDLIPTD